MADLFSLAVAAFDAQDHARAAHPEVVTPRSRPIAWFGDIGAYSASPVRIMTTGLNPSQVEFPTEDPERRFPSARGVTVADDRYLASLDAYFRTDPYWRWFNTYRSLLEGLDASFDGSFGSSTAVHTDLCSPVPTSPTWSRLPQDVRDTLARPGVVLWHELVRQLRPHVVLLSVAWHHLGKIELESLDPHWTVVHRITQARGTYEVRSRRYDVQGQPVLVVWGRAANTPFGSISYSARRAIGTITGKEIA